MATQSFGSTSSSYTNNSPTTVTNSVWINNTGTGGTGLYTSTSNAVIINNPTPEMLLRTAQGLKLNANDYLKYDENDNIVLVRKHSDGRLSKSLIPLTHRGTIDLKSRKEVDLDPNTVLRLPDGGIIEINDLGEVVREVFVNARDKVIDVLGGNDVLYESLAFCHFNEIAISEGLNTKATFILPNGVKVHLFPDDHIEIDEADGKQLYKTAGVREFNRYLNGSDLLEDFIHYCAEQKITKKDFSELPISLFIYWLIVKAAEADGDPVDEVVPLLTHAVNEKKNYLHRCKCCGKFLSKKFETNSINFCSPEHMGAFLNQIGDKP